MNDQIEYGLPTQLAIETTGKTGSIVVMRGEYAIFAEDLSGPSRSAAAIGPALERAICYCNKETQRLDFISVADGPGSFTGLRIGVTAAKTLSYALSIPLVAVDSLAAIAAAAFQEKDGLDTVLVAIDAYRGQVFTGGFERNTLLAGASQRGSDWTAHPSNVEVVSSEAWSEILGSSSASMVAGDEKPFRTSLREGIWKRKLLDAFGVGLLGLRAAKLNQWSDPLALVPRYLRPSAAEEQSLQKSK